METRENEPSSTKLLHSYLAVFSLSATVHENFEKISSTVIMYCIERNQASARRVQVGYDQINHAHSEPVALAQTEVFFLDELHQIYLNVLEDAAITTREQSKLRQNDDTHP